MPQCGVVLVQFVAIGCSNAHTSPLEGAGRSAIFSCVCDLQLLQYILQYIHVACEHVYWNRALHWFKTKCWYSLKCFLVDPFIINMLQNSSFACATKIMFIRQTTVMVEQLWIIQKYTKPS